MMRKRAVEHAAAVDERAGKRQRGPPTHKGKEVFNLDPPIPPKTRREATGAKDAFLQFHK